MKKCQKHFRSALATFEPQISRSKTLRGGKHPAGQRALLKGIIAKYLHKYIYILLILIVFSWQ